MQLLTKALRQRIPQLSTQEDNPDPLVVCKFFTPDSSWTWYVIEFDGDDTFFGLVDGLERELGYFSLRELQQVRGAFGLPVERDRYFVPCTLAALR